MGMLADEVRRCSDSGVVQVVFVFDGASGRVIQVSTPNEADAQVAQCVQRVARDSCMPHFRKATFTLSFPFKFGHRYRDEPPGVPQCPPSADPEAAQASAREVYQARYGRACEAALAPEGASETEEPKTVPPPPSDEPVRELDNAAKRPVLMTRIKEVERCYADALDGWPALEGKLELRLAIAASGQVESTRVVSSSFPLPELVCCLRQVVQSLQFPAATDGSRASATYDFAFRP
jgi:hypothetical protein